MNGPERAEKDRAHMRAALALAARRLGETWPNPAVGCVIVGAEGRVVGRGATAPGGRPHAETEALAMAGAASRGASAYVTLEPCCHTGQTPPCTGALIEAGIARVVVALRDPDPRVNGAGIDALRAAGIAVEEGVLADEAADLAAGFVSVVTRGRPLVTLKLASTLDGRIATRAGESQWITGEPARRAAHALRGRHDAVLVGVGTLLADDPRLTCRLAGYRARPLVRIIADSHLRTRMTASVLSSIALGPVWFLIHDRTDTARKQAFAALGARLLPLPGAEAGVDLAAGLRALGQAGITRLLVEGGAQLAAALLRDDLVDRLAWFHAPTVMGGDGWPAAQGFGVAHLAAMPRFSRRAVTLIGDDVLSEFERFA
jgi:diaminohydroxyphosphoribosylaminopyrimidine deaminase/5-amino-6-(5-phosphoribosylamino)uracil reductase